MRTFNLLFIFSSATFTGKILKFLCFFDGLSNASGVKPAWKCFRISTRYSEITVERYYFAKIFRKARSASL
jgi:hypothetical protein